MSPPFSWWTEETHRGTPVVVKMENPNNWSMRELHTLSDDEVLNFSKTKNHRNKNAKQLTWVLLLKAHKAAGCLTSIAAALLTFSSAIRQRISSGRTDTKNSHTTLKLYIFLKVFAFLAALLLGFEIIACVCTLIRPFGVKGVFDLAYSSWVSIRVDYLAPPLQFLSNACVVLFIVQSVDRLVLSLGCFWIKFRNIKPVLSDGGNDLESGNGGDYFPMVLV